MPRDRQEREEYDEDFLPEVSIYDLRIEIRNTQQSDMRGPVIQRLVGLKLFANRKELYETNLFYSDSQVRFNPFFSALFKDYFADRMERSLQPTGIKLYLANFRELDGSYLIMASLVLEALVNYAHLREALDKIADDLQASIPIDDYSVTGVSITPHNTRAIRIAHRKLALAQSQVTHIQRMTVILSIVACIVAAAIIFYARLEEEKEGEAKKIEVTVAPLGTIPVTVTQPLRPPDNIPAHPVRPH